MSLSIAVIGGGISGLASALAMTGLGHRVTLYEGDDDLGGLGTTFPWRDTHLERFYHCILPADTALLARIRELGLEGELLWRETRMGFMYERRVWPMNTPADLLRFGPLSWIERVRMGWMGLRARYGGLHPSLDDITAESWIRGVVGDRCFDVLWKPLLSAKIGDHYSALPALWLSSRMHREKTQGPERKGCLVNGYRSLIDAFANVLRQRGATIRLRQRVRALLDDGARMSVSVDGESPAPYDLVIATLPLVSFQSLTSTLPVPRELASLSLDYQGVVSGVFLTRRPISGYYWMPWVHSGATAQGCIEMSALVPRRRTHELYVNYLVNYTHRDSELFRRDDDALLALYRRDLEALFPDAAGSIEEQRLFRAPFVEPIWTTGYRGRRPSPRVIPGKLYLACTAQVYPSVNSWNSCCDVVDELVPMIEQDVAAGAARGAA